MGDNKSPVSTQGTESGSEEGAVQGIELRGRSFINAYGKKKDKNMMARLPTMLKKGGSTLIPRLEDGEEGKRLVVFDLDETIVYAREGPLMMRPHAEDLLKSVGEVTEVAFWTAGERSYAKAVTAELEKKIWGKTPSGVIKHLITRNKSWFDEEDYTKDLNLLGRNMNDVLIVENTPDCVRLNPKNAIIVEDFEGAHDTMHTLEALKEVILDLVRSSLPVAEFIPQCEKLERQKIGGVWVYYLTAGKRGGKKVLKENRDKNKKNEEEGSEPSSSSSETEEEPAKPAKKTTKKPTAKNGKKKRPVSDSDTEPEEDPKPKAKKNKKK
eukprot:TRINITY_DN42510_c0_g1_i1.p1 TRINITY_DN42510_c0_g1~~TRINITY_DN42510_c0_g1_i1.p1  ORF type:complete len:348 (+),score=102.54 TRINITY_DN42510_c0_g1_i1:70-1044(+)